MPAKLKETLSAIMGELRQIASTETVVGNPISLGNKMVVPVSRIMVGFGVGGTEKGSEKQKEGFSGGGAGGARVDPIGFIIIEEEKVSFLPTTGGKFEGLIDAIPGIVDKIKDLKGSRAKEVQEKDA